MNEQLPDWLASVAHRMITDFNDTAMIAHNASKGTEREASIVRQFMDRYLPGHVRLAHSGEVRSADGQVSSQQDLLIVDPATPPLYKGDLYQVVPIECVYAAGEAASSLDSAKFLETWAKVSDLKSMRKEAVRLPNNTVVIRTGGLKAYGRQWSQFPTAAFLFAFDSIKLETLAELMYDASLTTFPERRIDAVFVLQKGIVGWCDNQGVLQYRPLADSDVLVTESTPAQVLLWMCIWLWEILSDAWPTPLDLRKYMGEGVLSQKVGVYRGRPDLA